MAASSSSVPSTTFNGSAQPLAAAVAGGSASSSSSSSAAVSLAHGLLMGASSSSAASAAAKVPNFTPYHGLRICQASPANLIFVANRSGSSSGEERTGPPPAKKAKMETTCAQSEFDRNRTHYFNAEEIRNYFLSHLIQEGLSASIPEQGLLDLCLEYARDVVLFVINRSLSSLQRNKRLALSTPKVHFRLTDLAETAAHEASMYPVFPQKVSICALVMPKGVSNISLYTTQGRIAQAARHGMEGARTLGIRQAGNNQTESWVSLLPSDSWNHLVPEPSNPTLNLSDRFVCKIEVTRPFSIQTQPIHRFFQVVNSIHAWKRKQWLKSPSGSFLLPCEVFALYGMDPFKVRLDVPGPLIANESELDIPGRIFADDTQPLESSRQVIDTPRPPQSFVRQAKEVFNIDHVGYSFNVFHFVSEDVSRSELWLKIANVYQYYAGLESPISWPMCDQETGGAHRQLPQG